MINENIINYKVLEKLYIFNKIAYGLEFKKFEF